MTQKKDDILKKRKALESKLRTHLDELSSKDKENLQAIAIKYDQTQKKAPTIVAAGRGKLATKILSLAEEHKVPMIEDPKLSKLLTSIKIKTEIPPHLFKVVVEILAFIFYLEIDLFT